MSLLDRPGLALYCVPIAFASALVRCAACFLVCECPKASKLPHGYAMGLYDKLAKKQGGGAKGFQVSHPKVSLQSVISDPNQTPDHKRIVRAEAANTNGFETLGLFSAAVVIAQVAKIAPRTTNLLAIGYVLSRVVYNFLYIGIEDDKAANARTGIWFLGIGLNLALFILSANRIGSPTFKF